MKISVGSLHRLAQSLLMQRAVFLLPGFSLIGLGIAMFFTRHSFDVLLSIFFLSTGLALTVAVFWVSRVTREIRVQLKKIPSGLVVQGIQIGAKSHSSSEAQTEGKKVIFH